MAGFMRRFSPSCVKIGLLLPLALLILFLTSRTYRNDDQYLQNNASFVTQQTVQESIPVEGTINSKLPPTSAPEQRGDIAVVILTTKSFHHRLQWALKSWWTPDLDLLVEVLSDTTENSIVASDGEKLVIPNVINTGCDNSYYLGLDCKNYWMLKRWREDPKWKNVKWVYRLMDDTWLHYENMAWLTKQYDHRKPMVIGELVCRASIPYADGGPGFLISRGVVDHPNALSVWNSSLAERMDQPLDDVVWGQYAKNLPITVIHNNGISHASVKNDSELYQYFLKQEGQPWPMNFRPIAYHQSGDTLGYMPTFNERLQAIDYGIPHPHPYLAPDCRCISPHHRRCSITGELSDGKCKLASMDLECYGPGPWPNR